VGVTMKLKELKCENCGADLKVNNETKEVKCEYCHTKFKVDNGMLFDDMEQAGYEFEKGKLRAQKEHRDQQLKSLHGNFSSNNGEISPIVEFLVTFLAGTLGVHRLMKGQIGM
jgi:DNA-directed RNA polymerase subunit RPC12/RpoP